MKTRSAPALLDPCSTLNRSAGPDCPPAAPRPKAGPLSLAATLATLAFAPFVDGAVVLSNLSGFSQPYVNHSSALLGGNSNPSYEAVRVTTGPGSWTLNSVTVLATFSLPARMEIWQGATPGSIGSPTYSSNAQSSNALDANYDLTSTTFTFATTVTLSGGTDYWFALFPTTTNTAFWYYHSTATPSSGYGWSQNAIQGTYASSAWSYSDTKKFASLEIDATQVQSSGVPDGTTTALMLAPLGLGLAWAGRRRGQPTRP